MRLTLPWRGKVASRGAKRHVRRGGVISPRAQACVERSPHPARPLRAERPSPSRGGWACPKRHHCEERSDDAIQTASAERFWIASLRRCARNDARGEFLINTH